MTNGQLYHVWVQGPVPLQCHLCDWHDVVEGQPWLADVLEPVETHMESAHPEVR